MKKIVLISFLFFLNYKLVSSNEPFVVLEYKGDFSNQSGKKINKNNKFIKNQSYSTSHKVKPGESLSGILNKYYGNTGLNMRIVEISIIEINKHAFVRNNPNYLFAGKKIKIPSINEIMNLVKNKPNVNSGSNNRTNHIYFYGN
ncbi:MAG: hypothetical protein CMM95_03130 [Rickettsiales bacterium]|nr:hypothetical protein [Rickettsiales bacterium]|tara:strand:- start:57 stop:488 length:432 start_codon:yes stop_codon:yes gene_type:complete